MSERDALPPGGTAAYDLSVAKQHTSCATAQKVMDAFHRCRTERRASCTRTVLARWRCTGTRVALLPLGAPRVFSGGFTCRSGDRRVRGAYQENGPRCFGAAARDLARPCANPARSVYPERTSDEPHALDAGAAGCDPDPSNACVFGASPAAAKRTVALVGDSHTFHWRASLSLVAQVQSWRGYSLSAGGCFFSEVAYLFTDGCGDWYRGAAAWFGDHPEVSTVFVTANADTPVAVAPGQTSLGVKAQGAERALRALPRTVKHIVVLRDTPASTQPTFDCMWRVVDAGMQRAGQACPLARSVALREDPAVLAARALHAGRYQVIDMSRYFCGARSCYPVIGGVRVNGDIWGHITVTYMRTLGPYLLRELHRLMAGWQDAR